MTEAQGVRRLLAEAARALTEAGLESSAALDAALLMAHVLETDRAGLLARGDAPLTQAQLAAWREALRRRLAHEPVSHILGYREFWDGRFLVNPHVLDPRPDSETVIEAALAHFAGKPAPARILDLGTGSGCLLVTLLKVFLNSLGAGVDIHYNALHTARENARRQQVGDRAVWLCGDWCKPLAGQYDLVVSNPPYIAGMEKAELSRSVLEYEPHIALFGGDDGLACYRILAAGLKPHVAGGGAVLLEVGIRQAEPVAEIFISRGWRAAGRWKDLGGVERVIGFEPTHEHET